MILRRRPVLILAAILLADSAAILLALTLLFHSLPTLHPFDLATQQHIHTLASPRLTSVLLAFTWLGAIRTFAPALGLAVATLSWQRRHRLAALLSLPVIWALLLNEFFKLHFHRSRPLVPWSVPAAMAPAEHTFSFPSGHSFFAVVLYGTLTYAALRHHPPPRRAASLILLASSLPLAIGFSRIYLGMHYPTDVLAGYLAGALVLLATVLIDRRLRPPGSTHSRASHTGPPAAP